MGKMKVKQIMTEKIQAENPDLISSENNTLSFNNYKYCILN